MMLGLLRFVREINGNDDEADRGGFLKRGHEIDFSPRRSDTFFTWFAGFSSCLRLVSVCEYPISITGCATTALHSLKTTGFLLSGVILHEAKHARIALDASAGSSRYPHLSVFRLSERADKAIFPARGRSTCNLVA